jgi:hypothetical protein
MCVPFLACASPTLAPVYPNWFIDRLADQQIAHTLGGKAR